MLVAVPTAVHTAYSMEESLSSDVEPDPTGLNHRPVEVQQLLRAFPAEPSSLTTTTTLQPHLGAHAQRAATWRSTPRSRAGPSASTSCALEKDGRAAARAGADLHADARSLAAPTDLAGDISRRDHSWRADGTLPPYPSHLAAAEPAEIKAADVLAAPHVRPPPAEGSVELAAAARRAGAEAQAPAPVPALLAAAMATTASPMLAALAAFAVAVAVEGMTGSPGTTAATAGAVWLMPELLAALTALGAAGVAKRVEALLSGGASARVLVVADTAPRPAAAADPAPVLPLEAPLVAPGSFARLQCGAPSHASHRHRRGIVQRGLQRACSPWREGQARCCRCCPALLPPRHRALALSPRPAMLTGCPQPHHQQWLPPPDGPTILWGAMPPPPAGYCIVWPAAAAPRAVAAPCGAAASPCVHAPAPCVSYATTVATTVAGSRTGAGAPAAPFRVSPAVAAAVAAPARVQEGVVIAGTGVTHRLPAAPPAAVAATRKQSRWSNNTVWGAVPPSSAGYRIMWPATAAPRAVAVPGGAAASPRVHTPPPCVSYSTAVAGSRTNAGAPAAPFRVSPAVAAAQSWHPSEPRSEWSEQLA